MDKMFARGRTAEVLRLDDGKVLKLFFPEQPIEDAELEYNNAKLAYEAGCTPIRVYDLIERDGRYGFTMDYCPGVSQNDMVKKNPLYLFKGGTELGRQMAMVHTKKCHELRDIRVYTCDLLDNCEYLDFLTQEEKDKAKAYISSLPEEDTVLHLDLSTANLLIDRDGPVGIIDWTTAARGNRAVDYALMEHFFTKAELFAEATPLENWGYDKVRKIVGHYFFKEYQRIMPLDEEEVDKYRLVTMVFRKKWNMQLEAQIVNDAIRECIAKI